MRAARRCPGACAAAVRPGARVRSCRGAAVRRRLLLCFQGSGHVDDLHVVARDKTRVAHRVAREPPLRVVGRLVDHLEIRKMCVSVRVVQKR